MIVCHDYEDTCDIIRGHNLQRYNEFKERGHDLTKMREQIRTKWKQILNTFTRDLLFLGCLFCGT